MPRPSTTTEKIKRDHWIHKIRVTRDELEVIKQRAIEAGKSDSDFRREAMLNDVVVGKNVVNLEAIKLLMAIGSELRPIGTNFNQIAKSMNSYQSIDARQFGALMSRHDDILEKLDTVLMEVISQ